MDAHKTTNYSVKLRKFCDFFFKYLFKILSYINSYQVKKIIFNQLLKNYPLKKNLKSK